MILDPEVLFTISAAPSRTPTRVPLRSAWSLCFLLTLACSSPPEAPPSTPPPGGGQSGGGNAATAGSAGAGGALAGGGTGGAAAGTAGTGGTAAGASGSAGASGGGSGGSGGTVAMGWPPNAVAAVTLTYDDGLDTHLNIVAPALDARGLKGTFFLSNFEGTDHKWALPNPAMPLTERHMAWAAVAANGHEIASHTVNHPCGSNKAPGYLLSDYDMPRMAAELDDSIARLNALGGSEPYTFAYPCGSDNAGIGPGGEDYSPLVAERFLAARVSMGGINDPDAVDLLRVSNVDTEGATGEELRAQVDMAIAQGGWLVFLFHGVGVEQLTCPGDLPYAPETCMINYLVTSEEAHTSLLDYLLEKQDQVWTATFKQVAQAVSAP